MSAVKGRAVSALDIRKYMYTLFTDLVKTLPTASEHEHGSIQTRNIGVCVSGGPDSMALAHLLSTFPPVQNIKLRPIAWIIDHRARPESTTEARKVSSFLQQMGIESEILSMKWPTHVPPLEIPGFESKARKERYRLTAQAALRHGVQHVFLGHHQDDQVETMIMRLQRNYKQGLGSLHGIMDATPFPGCDDIHGAHEAGHWTSAISNARMAAARFGLKLPGGAVSGLSLPGGISLHRPLLSCRKVDLLETCKENGIPYVIDATNHDPQFTLRNAVRHMRTLHKLPRALAGPRLIRLQSLAADRLELIQTEGLQCLRHFRFHELNLVSGIVTVEIPPLKAMPTQYQPSISNAIARLLNMVSPAPRDAQKLQIDDSVFAALLANPAADDGAPAYEAGRTWPYQRVQFKLVCEQTNTWRLSRQPMRPNECSYNTWHFAEADQLRGDDSALTERQTHVSATRPKDNNPWQSLRGQSVGSTGEDYFTQWTLWDNRFWIQFRAKNPQNFHRIQIQPLSTKTWGDFRARLKRADRKYALPILTRLNHLLSRLAPDDTKFGIPVLLYNGQIFSFPTLQFPTPKQDPSHLMPNPGVDIRIRYKAIPDMESLMMVGNSDQRGDTLKTSTLLEILDLQEQRESLSGAIMSV